MLRFGIIGYGIRGKSFAEIIQHNAYAKLIAVSDVNKNSRNLAKKLKVATYIDYREMIEKENLDSVIIATPDHLHREPVICAAKYRLHLAVEKPLATSTQDAEAMVNAIKKAGVKCMVLFGNRWNAPFVEAKEAIDRGELGIITNIDTCMNDTIWVPTEMLSWAKFSTPGWFFNIALY